MALPKLPSLEEVLRNPKLVYQLPLPMINQIKRMLVQVQQSSGEATNVPVNPVVMAAANPRFRWMDTRHLHYLGEELAESVRLSKDGGESAARIITMPPRHAKSTTAAQWGPFWYLCRYPQDHVLYISYEANFARKWGARVRQLVELYGAEYGLYLDPKKTASDDWELTSGGGMKTVGAGGGISGNPVQLLIADDLFKNYEEASSEVLREKMWEWWDTTVVQRIEPDTTTWLIGTRYFEDDIIGRVIKHSQIGDGIRFEEINLRAKAEADDPIGREPGDGLWTDHPLKNGSTWGQDYYDKREGSVSSYTWHSVYQQRPSPPGGNMVDPSWWRYYRLTEMPGTFDQECQSWDLALDSLKKSDSYYCGGVLSRKGALVFVRDSFHEHCDINRIVTTIQAWDRIYPGARTKLVERSLAGPALVSMMRNRVGGMTSWPPKGRQKESKESCLDAIIPDIRSGNVLLPIHPDGSKPKWVQELVEELRQFPRGAHDDYVDMLSQGAGFLLPSARQSLDRDHAAAKAHAPSLPPDQAQAQALHAHIKRIAKPKMEALDRAARVLDFHRTARSGGGRRRRVMC